MKIKLILILVLVTFALLIRVYKIDQVPQSLYYDEVDYGYQARSLIETFKDYRGNLSPFYVHSFNDIRTPIPAYFTVLTTFVFKTPEVQVRAPSAILGTLVVFIAFLLTYLWSKNFATSFFVGLVFATNPWQIQYSRFAHEGMSMMMIYFLGLWSFYKALAPKKYYFLLAATVFLSLAVYTYRTMSLYVPITFLILFLIYREELLQFGLKRLIILVILASLIITPFLYATTLGAPDTPRIKQLAIFSDPEVPIWVQRNREIDSQDYLSPDIGKKPTKLSFIFHSKPLSWLDSFFNNYYQTFSSEFLFIRGDPNLRQSIGKMGQLFFIDILAILAGLCLILKNIKVKHYQWLLAWFLTAPIPSALTVDGAYHASRLLIFSGPLLLLVGLGWWTIWESLRDFARRTILLLVIGLWILLFAFYLHRYLVHYPIESARYFGYGFKQAMLKISQLEKNYQKVVMVPTNDPPMIYYLFWSKTPPRFLHEYGTDFSIDKIRGKKLDKYKVADWSTEVGREYDMFERLEPKTLYLVTKRQLPMDLRGGASAPRGIRLLEVITYPDKEVAFYLIDRNPDYKP